MSRILDSQIKVLNREDGTAIRYEVGVETACARALAELRSECEPASGRHTPSPGTSRSLRRGVAFLVAVLAAVAILAAFPASAQDFYDDQLHAGRDSFQAGRNLEAADELRIAAFGLLDRPQLLTEALVRLAIVQNVLSDGPGVTHSLERFLDVEGRFHLYTGLSLDASTRSGFEAILLKTVPRSTIAAVPSLIGLLDSEQQKIARLPRTERLKALEAAAVREPRNPVWPLALAREYAASGESPQVVRWAGQVLQLDANSTDARSLLAHARAARGECREAVSLLDRMGASDLAQHPELMADQLICLVELKRWVDAQGALNRLPDPLKSRDDVKRATQTLREQAVPVRKPGRAGGATATASDPAEPSAGRPAVARPPTDLAPKTSAGGSPEPAESSRESGPPRSVAPSRAADGSASRAERPAGGVNEAVRRESVRTLEESRQLVAEGKYQNATRVLVRSVQEDPANRDLRRALLESSVLASDWRTAGAQAALVAPFNAGEELSMFYAAVALYENGKRDDAKRLMERAQPHMSPSPFADYYMRVILTQ
jgi:thioredoxin-like negative regulator of GroEL